MSNEVDVLMTNAKQWQKELQALRKLLLDCGLTETVKWRNACYTTNNTNIALIHGFKEYCAILFFKGALLADAHKILIQQTENVQLARQIRFTNTKEIIKLHATLKAYVYEAIEVEKSGIKLEKKKTVTQIELPEELQQLFKKNIAFKKAFASLTPGRQRAYHLYFSSAKQASTRLNRIENYIQKILKGIGLNDCTCGLSKRMPNCDGSHKFLKEKIN
jgi:uncharacterized protein YdeI (YjbR/CyaY-like superfamily)